jgi:Na+-translocating ferredoxin:NAD+ oxidoreductase RnfC subunit
MLEIQKGVPMPEAEAKTRKNAKYPFKGMELNDSFLVPLKKDEDIEKAMVKVNANARRYGKDLNATFETRVVKEGEKVKGIGVWRTK